jgi:hypothetical protein
MVAAGQAHTRGHKALARPERPRPRQSVTAHDTDGLARHLVQQVPRNPPHTLTRTCKMLGVLDSNSCMRDMDTEMNCRDTAAVTQGWHEWW